MNNDNNQVRLLILGDLHGVQPDIKVAEKDYDAIILPGDICGDDIRKYIKKWSDLQMYIETEIDFNKVCPLWKQRILDVKSKWKGRQILKKLNKIGKPVFLVPGNWDPTPNDGFKIDNQKIKNKSYKSWTRILRRLDNVHDIEHTKKHFMGLTLIGHGSTSSPEPIEKMSKRDFMFEEDYLDYKERYNYFKKVEKKLSKFCEKSKYPVVLLSHNAVYGTKLDKIYAPTKAIHNQHYGSIIARDIVEKYQPILAIGGHIHEGHGKQKIRKTTCINSGFGSDVNTIVTIDSFKGKVLSVEFIGENDFHK